MSHSDPGAPPAGIEDVSPAWLTAALRSTGVLSTSANARSMDTQPVGTGAGITGAVYRLCVEYDIAETPAPRSIIAKLAAPDQDLRALLGGQMGLYEREVKFYTDLAAEVPVDSPRLYFSAWSPATQHAVLLLEDLAGAKFGADDESCSSEEGERAAAAIARLHARWWRSPRLQSMPWLWREEEPAPELQDMVRERYPAFRERFGDIVDEHLWPFLDRVAGGGLPVFRGACTLIHGDFTPKNVCSRPDGGLVIFDWQFVGRGNPAIDLLRYVAAGLADPDPIGRMDGLLRRYHDALTENGIRDYALDQLRLDIRAAAVLRLLRPIGIGGDPADIDDVRDATVRRELSDAAALLAGATEREVFG